MPRGCEGNNRSGVTEACTRQGQSKGDHHSTCAAHGVWHRPTAGYCACLACLNILCLALLYDYIVL